MVRFSRILSEMNFLMKLFAVCAFTISAGCAWISPYTDVASAGAPYVAEPVSVPTESREIKNIIFMIGDGMGLEQVGAAWVANRQKLFLDGAPVVGIARTYSANRLITDSAAAGTALACGKKINNDVIGIDPAGIPLKSSIALAKESGMATGIIVTKSIADATPAAFYAHQKNRTMSEEIIAELVESEIDFIAGGGAKYFSKRADKRDIFGEFAAKHYFIARTMENLETNVPAGTQFLGIFAEKHCESAEKRGDFLPRISKFALERLSKNPRGFFLMIEGSKIDTEGHAVNLDGVVAETLDFDRALGEVLRFAKRNPGTLVVVTADHATGGLTIIDGSLATGQVKGNFSTNCHNGITVPVYAFGTGATRFGGIYENTEIARRMHEIIRAR